jgi:pyruvate,water dikinase
VGLARLEFILTAQVGIHPLALVWFDELTAFAETGELAPPLLPFRDHLMAEDRQELRTLLGAVERRISGHPSPSAFFVNRIRTGVGLICASFYPRPVLVRLSHPRFAPAFALELEALAQVRDRLGLDNLQIMVPFSRSPTEGAAVVEMLEEAGVGPDSGTPLFLMSRSPRTCSRPRLSSRR